MTFDSMTERLQELKIRAQQSLDSIKNSEDAQNLRVEFLGKKGALTQILKELGGMDIQSRAQIGQLANHFKDFFEIEIARVLKEQKERQLAQKLQAEKIDLTLPGRAQKVGLTHPITRTLTQVIDFFFRFGFDVRSGPEIETDYYNFQALAIPPDHPAREMQDTFYLKPFSEVEWGDQNPTLISKDSDKLQSSFHLSPLLLRTHTSPVQIRVMEHQKPPIRMISPGVVYRKDSDMTHTPMFHQVEGLYVDQGVSMADLKGVLQRFLKDFFGSSVQLRFRPSYFPFTEPSAELDISCVLCSQKGCRVCKGSGWLEVMGCGMVDPRVFESVKIDAEIYSGFAFGMGIERLTLLKLGLDDLRRFFENDLRFIETV